MTSTALKPLTGTYFSVEAGPVALPCCTVVLFTATLVPLSFFFVVSLFALGAASFEASWLANGVAFAFCAAFLRCSQIFPGAETGVGAADVADFEASCSATLADSAGLDCSVFGGIGAVLGAVDGLGEAVDERDCD